MTPVAERLPYHCLPEFFEIINAYGAYIRERDIVRKANKEEKIPSILNRELSLHTIDVYSWQHREHGCSDGITESAKDEIENKVISFLKRRKDIRTKNLISTQKYYKKLKHEFRENHPTLVEMFEKSLTDHSTYMENKKRVAYHKHTDILSLSPRFIAFFNFQFNGGDASRIAYSNFTDVLIKRTGLFGLSSDEIELLHRKLGTYSNRVNDYNLNFEDIELLAKALKVFINSIEESDTENMGKYITSTTDDESTFEEKKKIVSGIITKNIARFTKLLAVYEDINNR